MTSSIRFSLLFFLSTFFAPSVLSAQSPSSDIEKLQFEVASVKPNKTGNPNSSVSGCSPAVAASQPMWRCAC